MDVKGQIVKPLVDFGKDSMRLVNKCTKPDRKEYQKIVSRTALGFVAMGFIGFFVKLVFIPINNIISKSVGGDRESGGGKRSFPCLLVLLLTLLSQ